MRAFVEHRDHPPAAGRHDVEGLHVERGQVVHPDQNNVLARNIAAPLAALLIAIEQVCERARRDEADAEDEGMDDRR